MNAINILLACLGGGVTLMVAVGMILLTPHGVEPRAEAPYEQPRSREQPEVGLDAEVAPSP
jgi:hypothetical protein